GEDAPPGVAAGRGTGPAAGATGTGDEDGTILTGTGAVVDGRGAAAGSAAGVALAAGWKPNGILGLAASGAAVGLSDRTRLPPSIVDAPGRAPPANTCGEAPVRAWMLPGPVVGGRLV